MNPTVALVIDSGYQVRTILRSGVLDHFLITDCRVVILTRPAGEEHLQAEFGWKDEICVYPIVCSKPRPAYYLTLWERTFAGRALSVKTHDIYWQQVRARYPRRYALRRALGRQVTSWLSDLGLWLDRRLIQSPANSVILRNQEPDLVVVGSLGRSPYDTQMMRHAKREGMPTLCVLRSWDNLTAKEYLRERPNKLIVWNEINKREAVELYAFPETDVYVGGVPDFDRYFRATAYSDRADFCRQLGLDPERAILLLSGAGFVVCPDFLDDIVQILVEAIEGGRFVRPAQLLIRPHPNVYVQNGPGQGTEADLQRYEALNPRVQGDRPTVDRERLTGDLSVGELQHLQEVLCHSDVVLNFFGTISLEAAIVDTPVVNIGFDGFKRRPYHASVRSYGDYTHFQPLIEYGATRVAFSPDELIAHINAYLADPTLDTIGRRQATELLCGYTDGRSAERVARCLADYAVGIWPPHPLPDDSSNWPTMDP